MKKITRMAALGVLLLVGATGTAFANGTSAPEPEPVRYMPPPPPPAPEPAPAPAPVAVADTCDEGFYISGAAGVGIPSVKVSGSSVAMDAGLALNGAVGYDFGDARLEAAVGYQTNDISQAGEDGSMLTVMGNAYYDFDAGSGIKPYIMGGLGMANIDTSFTSDDTVFAWQVGAGIGVEVAKCTTLDLGYRYVKPDDANLDGANVEVESHNILLGLRYNF